MWYGGADASQEIVEIQTSGLPSDGDPKGAVGFILTALSIGVLDIIDVDRSVNGTNVVEVLRYLFAVRGAPDFIRSDNGPEFACRAVKRWLNHAGVKTLFVALGAHGRTDTLNHSMKSYVMSCLTGSCFCVSMSCDTIVDRWRMGYNHYRPHSSLGYMSPAAFAANCLGSDFATLRQPQDKESPLIEAGT
jgi:hypothetical protein